MSEEEEFEYIEAKPVGTPTVTFRLSDGTTVMIDVEMRRVGKKIKDDGKPAYHFDFGQRVRVKTTAKTFKVKKYAVLSLH